MKNETRAYPTKFLSSIRRRFVGSVAPLENRVYVRGELGEFTQEIAPILAQFLGESRSSLTGIGVASLVTPEVLVEIEATAALMRKT